MHALLCATNRPQPRDPPARPDGGRALRSEADDLPSLPTSDGDAETAAAGATEALRHRQCAQSERAVRMRVRRVRSDADATGRGRRRCAAVEVRLAGQPPADEAAHAGPCDHHVLCGVLSMSGAVLGAHGTGTGGELRRRDARGLRQHGDAFVQWRVGGRWRLDGGLATSDVQRGDVEGDGDSLRFGGRARGGRRSGRRLRSNVCQRGTSAVRLTDSFGRK